MTLARHVFQTIWSHGRFFPKCGIASGVYEMAGRPFQHKRLREARWTSASPFIERSERSAPVHRTIRRAGASPPRGIAPRARESRSPADVNPTNRAHIPRSDARAPPRCVGLRLVRENCRGQRPAARARGLSSTSPDHSSQFGEFCSILQRSLRSNCTTTTSTL